MWLPHLALSWVFLASLSFVSFSRISDVEARRHGGYAKQNKHATISTVISQRQWKPERNKRDLIDVCIDLSTTANLRPLLGIDLQSCLCLRDLNIWLDTYVGADSDDLGLRTLVTAVLNPLFDAAPSCGHLPAHAHRACTPANPCHYECDTGYELMGTQCVCNGCSAPSPVPRPLTVRADPSDPLDVNLNPLLCVDADLGPELNTVDNDLLDLGQLLHPGHCQASRVSLSASLLAAPTQNANPAPNPSSSSTESVPSPSSLPPPPCPQSSVDNLLVILHEILVEVGPFLQGLLGDLSLFLGHQDPSSSQISHSDVLSSLGVVVNSSTDLANDLANVKAELRLQPLLNLTSNIVEGLGHCLGLSGVDDKLNSLLKQTLVAAQNLLHAVHTLETGLGAYDCTQELLESLCSGLHLSKRFPFSCDPADGSSGSAIGVALPPVDAKVDIGGPLNKLVLGLTDSLGLGAIVHPTRAYPIGPRDLLLTSDPSVIDVDANPLADAKVDLRSSLNGLVTGLAHNLGLSGLIHSSGSSSSSSLAGLAIGRSVTKVDALADLVAEIDVTRLDLKLVLAALSSSEPSRNTTPTPPPPSHSDSLLRSILDLGTNLATNLIGLNTDLSLTSHLVVQVGQLNGLLTTYLGLPGLEANLTSTVNHAVADTNKLLHELSDLERGLDDCGCIDALLQSSRHT